LGVTLRNRSLWAMGRSGPMSRGVCAIPIDVIPIRIEPIMASKQPIPTEIKRLRGNPGKRPLPHPGEEPEPERVETLPDPPDWVGEYGIKEWERVGPVLIEQRLLTEADLMAFAAYCANVHLMIVSMGDIEKNGTTVLGARGEVRNPALASFAQAVTSLRALATEFGMTPSSRGRMRLAGDDGESLADLMADDGTEDIE
jgi:P27 family predicted phage terminase small subunit